MTSKTRLPSVVTGGVKDAPVRRVLDQVKEMLDVWAGRRGNELDRVVTARDFIDGELGGLLRRAGGLHPEVGSAFGGGKTSVGGLRDLVAVGALESVVLRWDGIAQANYAYTEIWRAAVDNLGEAELIGTSIAAMFADDVGAGQSNYYWVRACSTSGDPGPFNATAGTRGGTAKSPDTVRELLTSKAWEAQRAYSMGEVVAPGVEVGGVALHFQAAVAGVSGASAPNWAAAAGIGSQIVDGTVTWVAVEAGRAPFVTGTVDGKPMVFMHGAAIKEATIENAAIKELAADKLYAVSGTLAEAIIGTGHITNAMIGQIIQSDDYQAGVKGWAINKNGAVEFRSGSFRGDIHSENAYVRGNVEATSIKANTANIVDTLQIRNEAVTIQRHVVNQNSYTTGYVSGHTRLSSGTWHTLAQTTIDAMGGSVSVTLAANSLSVMSGNSSTTATLRVVRSDGLEICSASVSASNMGDDNRTQTGNGKSPVSIGLDPNPLAGNVTYSVQFYVPTVGTGYGSVVGASLLVDGAKR